MDLEERGVFSHEIFTARLQEKPEKEGSREAAIEGAAAMEITRYFELPKSIEEAVCCGSLMRGEKKNENGGPRPNRRETFDRLRDFKRFRLINPLPVQFIRTGGENRFYQESLRFYQRPAFPLVPKRKDRQKCGDYPPAAFKTASLIPIFPSNDLAVRDDQKSHQQSHHETAVSLYRINTHISRLPKTT